MSYFGGFRAIVPYCCEVDFASTRSKLVSFPESQDENFKLVEEDRIFKVLIGLPGSAVCVGERGQVKVVVCKP